MTTKENESKQEIQTIPRRRGLTRFEDIDRLFDSLMNRGWMRPFQFEWPSFGELAEPFEGKIPQVDVVERDDEILVKAELPGVEKKDLDISVTRNSVTIKGTSKREEKEEKGDYLRREISSGSYLRTFSLPSDVDETKARAAYKDGVLELTLPKLEETKRHSIKVE